MTRPPARDARSEPYFARPVVLAVISVMALGLLLGAYSNHYENAFHFDDSHVIVDNLYVRGPGQIPRFFTDAMTFSSLPMNAMYRPVLTTTFAIDYWLGGGLAPRQFHVTQVSMLVLLGVGVWYLFVTVMNAAGTRWWHRYLALFAVTWFCVHTANTETVNYISSRSDLVSTLGVVAAFWVYLAFPRLRRFQLFLLPMVVGTLAKPPAVLFAPLLLAYILLFEEQLSASDVLSRRAWPRVGAAVRRAAPAFVVGAAVFFFVEYMNPPTQTYGGTDRLAYLQTQAYVWMHYLRLFVLPMGLTADTDWGLLQQWYDTRVVAGVLVVATLAVIGWRASSSPRTRPVAFGLFWFAVALMPASSIVPLAEVANEHRIFFPYLGLALAVTWAARLGLERWVTRWPSVGPMTVSVVALGVLAGHAVGTYQRNTVWASNEALWADVVEKSPNNGRAWMNYGLSQMARGRLERAQELFEHAQVLNPNYSVLETNLGIVSESLGDSEAAERHFVRALELTSDYAAGMYFYSLWLVNKGRADEALPRLRRSIALSPAYLLPRVLLMHLLYVRGDDDELAQLVSDTLAVASDEVVAGAYANGRTPLTVDGETPRQHLDRGFGFTNQNRILDGAIAFRHSLAGEPDSPDGLNNYGWALDTLGFPALAVVPLERAVELSPGHDRALNNLTAARNHAGAQ